MTDWIKHDGGECPVHPETIVEARHSIKDEIYPQTASYWDWSAVTEYRQLTGKE